MLMKLVVSMPHLLHISLQGWLLKHVALRNKVMFTRLTSQSWRRL